MDDGEFGHRLEGLDGLGGSDELYATVAGEAGQRFEELEDAAVGVVEFTEGFQIHEEVENLLFLWGVGNPADVFVGGEGIFAPGSVGEAVGDIVRQFVVLEQEFQLGSRGC